MKMSFNELISNLEVRQKSVLGGDTGRKFMWKHYLANILLTFTRYFIFRNDLYQAGWASCQALNFIVLK